MQNSMALDSPIQPMVEECISTWTRIMTRDASNETRLISHLRRLQAKGREDIEFVTSRLHACVEKLLAIDEQEAREEESRKRLEMLGHETDMMALDASLRAEKATMLARLLSAKTCAQLAFLALGQWRRATSKARRCRRVLLVLVGKHSSR